MTLTILISCLMLFFASSRSLRLQMMDDISQINDETFVVSESDRQLQFGQSMFGGTGLYMGGSMGLNTAYPSNQFYVNRSGALSAYYDALGGYGQYYAQPGATLGTTGLPRFTEVPGGRYVRNPYI
eukprot:GDKJ01021498.1.p1 GENE.GDKJ01021498.1~~GDKJ01021498.1.p1  ORF type:complete len:126 (+),score=12.42 GDKJ01021498.1:169-546(+)